MGVRRPSQGKRSCGGSPEVAEIAGLRQRDFGEKEKAIRELCRLYWPPFYRYFRAQGSVEREARQLTEEFFGRLPDVLPRGAAKRWKFRRLLLECVKRFFSRRHNGYFKKGRVARVAISEVDFAEEERLELPLADPVAPEQVFEMRWALSMNDRAVIRVRDGYYGKGKAGLYERLKDHYPHGSSALTYAALGEELGMNGSAIRAAWQRLRRCYAEALRDEIARTVHGAAELEQEVEHVRGTLGGRFADSE